MKKNLLAFVLGVSLIFVFMDCFSQKYIPARKLYQLNGLHEYRQFLNEVQNFGFRFDEEKNEFRDNYSNSIWTIKSETSDSWTTCYSVVVTPKNIGMLQTYLKGNATYRQTSSDGSQEYYVSTDNRLGITLKRSKSKWEFFVYKNKFK